MKLLICVFVVAAELCAFGLEIQAWPTPEYADTEVSTNFAFAVGEGGGRRLVFSLALED